MSVFHKFVAFTLYESIWAEEQMSVKQNLQIMQITKVYNFIVGSWKDLMFENYIYSFICGKYMTEIWPSHRPLQQVNNVSHWQSLR